MTVIKTRVIPVLLLKDRGLVKTVKFGNPRYIGDPINSVRIFNEKEVDELVFLDISATVAGRGPDFTTIEDIAGEAFMPMGYGGGITSIEDIRRVLALGFEKVILGTVTHDDTALVRQAVSIFGAQAITACIDVKKTFFGSYNLYSHSGRRRRPVTLDEHLTTIVGCGVGEVIINSIDRDGTMSGYDIAVIKAVSRRVSLPVIACGGASSLDDLALAVNEGGASAVAAGSLFVYKGRHRAVLINYPDRTTLQSRLP